MKWVKPLRLHKYIFWLSMPLLSLALLYILFDNRIWTDWRVWPLALPLILLPGYITWQVQVQFDHYIRTRYALLQQTGERVIFKLLTDMLLMAAFILLVLYIFDAAQILGYKLQQNDVRYALLAGLIITLVFEILWEVYYIIDKYKEVTEEKELFTQMQLEQEFDLLKQKVNPHFLFNCFNTLSSLITEDKERAEVFLDELCKVYRYLLRSNEDGMSTLETELKFIQSYYELLRTRHGDAINLQVEVDKQYHPYLLPALSLQMLVENVVKHNALSKNKPLVIEIFTTVGNKLVVNNNLQRRSVKPQGGRVGLNNIQTKYHLLHQEGFQVIEDEKNFTVVLPLIWNHGSGRKPEITATEKNN